MKSKEEYLERLNRIGKGLRSDAMEPTDMPMPTGVREITEHLAILIEIMLDIRELDNHIHNDIRTPLIYQGP